MFTKHMAHGCPINGNKNYYYHLKEKPENREKKVDK